MHASDPLIQRMSQVASDWKCADDRRHIFLSCYHLMSGNMLSALERGEFHDAEWVGKLLRRFAEYYFENLDRYECGKPASLVWTHAHEAAADPRLGGLQLLILGVNAHINYDLVFALRDVLEPEWPHLSAEQRALRYEDHCRVNQVIADTIDEVQDDIVEPMNPMLGWVDTLLGRLDEYVISKVITSWRGDVWKNTEHLLALDSTEAREQFRIKVENDAIRLEKIVRLV
jgi:hypothetical protein